MKIEVWSDVACPWCFLGKHRLDAALARAGGQHEVIFRAFELDPSTPRTFNDGLTHSQRIAKKLRITPERMEEMHARMLGLGNEDGIAFQFDRVQGGNSFDAHRVIALGKHRGVQLAVVERMMKAYFSDGEKIADADALVRLGSEAGLDAAEVRDVLAGDRLTAEVRADERDAGELGISGVPCFVFDRKTAVSGAQPIDVLVQALRS